MKRETFSAVALISLALFCLPSFCLSEGIDGHFWKKMDKMQKSLYVMGYKMGSLEATLTLNSLIDLRKEVKTRKELEISEAYCTDMIELMRKSFIIETYIPEENLEIIVEELDAFYARGRFLQKEIPEALSKIREEMYDKNPKLKETLKFKKK